MVGSRSTLVPLSKTANGSFVVRNRSHRALLTCMSRVLVVNDDGIHAPGLHALVAALASLDGVAVYVAAPTSERSATGHGITIHTPLIAYPVSVPHAKESYAITGLPADCTMLALGPLFAPGSFDLVVSGINRGNNYGLHVIYSGTVAAAREAAAACVPALALSLNAYTADADYTHAASAALPIIRRMLCRFGAAGGPGTGSSAALLGAVVNVNFPAGPLARMRGYVYARQSYETTLPSFAEVAVPDSVPGLCNLPRPLPAMARAWVNGLKYVARIDREPGTDSAAVADGYVAVSLVRLLSDATPASEVAPVQTAPPPPPALDATGLTDEAADYVLEVAAAAAKLAAGAFPVAVKLRPPLAAPAETSSL